MTNEYWIKDGELENADVDQDAPGHAMHVFTHLLNDISESLISSENKDAIKIGHIILDHIVDDFGGAVVDVIELRSQLLAEFDFDIYEFISGFTAYDRDTVLMAFNDGRIDPILWACKNLGWIRVVGDNLESWGIKPGVMKRTAWALHEIDEDPMHIWHWENRQNGKIVSLTTEQIQSGTISELTIRTIARIITEDPSIFLNR